MDYTISKKYIRFHPKV